MHTKYDLLRDIRSLGLDPAGTLLIHSSCKAIGPVEGGAHTVLDAWCEFYRDGLLIFPTHTWDRVGKKHPVYDSRSDPSCVGILSELFRQRPGVVRSLHPTHSVAALGKDAADYTAGEEHATTPLPRSGCWGKLLDRDATILFLGCSLRSNTFIHGVEEWAGIPDRISPWTEDLTILGPQGEEYHVAMHRHHCVAADRAGGDVSENYGKLEAPFRRLGALRYGKFGDALCAYGKARDMERIASALLEKEPDLFLSGEAIPGDWY